MEVGRCIFWMGGCGCSFFVDVWKWMKVGGDIYCVGGGKSGYFEGIFWVGVAGWSFFMGG